LLLNVNVDHFQIAVVGAEKEEGTLEEIICHSEKFVSCDLEAGLIVKAAMCVPYLV